MSGDIARKELRQRAIDRLLDRLEGVREHGPCRWTGRCPAHDDRSPSLSIRELDDGRVLIHCFAGCSATDIVASVGLALRDLFPSSGVHTGWPYGHHARPVRGRRHAHAALEALKTLDYDVLLVAIAAEALAGGEALDEASRAQLLEAAQRIRDVAELAA